MIDYPHDADAERLRILRINHPIAHASSTCATCFLLAQIDTRDAGSRGKDVEIVKLADLLHEARKEVFLALDGGHKKSETISGQNVEITRPRLTATTRVIEAARDMAFPIPCPPTAEIQQLDALERRDRLRQALVEYDSAPPAVKGERVTSAQPSEVAEVVPDNSFKPETGARVVEAARELKFGAYPAHGSGFVWTLIEGDPDKLSTALSDYDSASNGGERSLIVTGEEAIVPEAFVAAVRRHVASYKPGTLIGSELNLAIHLRDRDGDMWEPWCVPGTVEYDAEIVSKENEG